MLRSLVGSEMCIRDSPTGERAATTGGSSSSSSMVPSPPRHPSSAGDSNLQVSAVIKGRSKLFVNRPGVPSSPASATLGGGGQQTEASFRSRNANTSFWGASIGAVSYTHLTLPTKRIV
eukprot:TRINITY_DN44495_c0_g1_i2.p1 TRINITY_DN44495_c0_g1~~TRINITY_DN44495_c0_g1_i2.p1  ORF type:complete len:119 (-),score=33.66 TRINITY_DN44495_c0_g1_i2:136-492(-)